AAAEKNIPLVLEAWKTARRQQPDLKMVVVGGGPVEAKLRRHWPEVHFAGMRYDEDLARHYASADLFLFASTTETFGNVVLEALASGLVVHTYDYAAGRQFIQEGRNGYLSPLDDPARFIRKTGEILGARAQWPAIRSAARATAERHPWSETIKRFGTLLENAVETSRNSMQIGIVPAS
ncbi:MAG: glycosyltransferase, partial [Verrucomicrobiota bacterium]